MNRRLFSIALILVATLGVVSWLKAGSAGPVSGSATLCYPLGTLALLVLGTWGLMRLFSQRKADESDGTKDMGDEETAETPMEQDDSDESDGFGGSDADEDA
jgi:hypothetical protein